MANKIQVKRGVKASLPVLSIAEFGFCTDTKELFIGSATGNIEFPNADHTHDFTHDHDDRYYKQSEVNTKLNGKSDIGHDHASLYYSKTDVDTKLSGKSNTNHTHAYAPSVHNHDDRYYTETEIDTKLGSKADSTTLSGHTSNSTIHVTSGNKTTWNSKANKETIGTVKPTDGSMWYQVI